MPAFTTIAAGVGLAATAATTTGSFIQANRQRNAMLDAEKKAEDAMKEARKKLDVNFYAALSIPKEAYAQQVQANLVAGAGAIQAATEGEGRGAGAVAGMVQAQQNQAQNEIRANMGQDIYNLQAATAQEDSRLRDIGIQLDLGEVEGAQLAAANAQEMSAQAVQQGMQGVTSLTSQLAEKAPLFDKGSLRENDVLMKQYNEAAKTNPALKEMGYQKAVSKLGAVGGVDFSGVSKLEPEAFNKGMIELSRTTLRDLNNRSWFDPEGKSINPFLNIQ
mgnify:CR=1 FL=1|tara:strand:- start:6634 stop:7461 length:828 start_codon:yes stop_codon:yes gene_type:complete